MWEQFNQSGCISTNHWTWTRWEKGKFVEDESYEWSDAENERRLGVRVRETKYFIFFREIRYKQREHNYWIERAGGWRIKIPFCKTYEQTRIANWIVVDLPIFILYLWFIFSRTPIRWCHSRAAECCAKPGSEKQGALSSRYRSPDKTTSHQRRLAKRRFFASSTNTINPSISLQCLARLSAFVKSVSDQETQYRRACIPLLSSWVSSTG